MLCRLSIAGIGKKHCCVVRAGAMENIEQPNLRGVGYRGERISYLSLGFQIFGFEKHAMKVGHGKYVDEDHLALFVILLINITL